MFRCILSTLAVALVLSSLSFAADWPQFRGPAGGRAVGDGTLPVEFGPDKNVVWKTPLPPGHSSPAVVGDKIFLTAVRDKEHLETLCLDRASGNILWRARAPHNMLEKIHGIGSYAQPSPAADSERVVVLFGSCGLFCYDHAGTQLWHVPMGPFNDDFGAGSSPILVDDRVIVCQDHDTDSFLAAFDKRTGQELWRIDRSRFARNYCTPAIWTVEGRRQIVTAGSLRVVGYDFESGRELWTAGGLSRVICMSPAIGEDNTLFVAGWSAGGEAGERISLEPFDDFAFQYDKNKNGTLEENEVKASTALASRFSQCDRDKDGRITREEYEQFRMLFDESQNAVLAIRPGGRGDVTDSHVAWSYDRYVPFCASPLYYQGRVFTIKDGGIFSSLDAASGDPGRTGRVMGTGNYYASPVAGDGKVYLLSQRGTLSVVEPSGSNWKVVHSAEFGDEVYATPALVAGRIYLRTSGHLYCFGEEGAGR